MNAANFFRVYLKLDRLKVCFIKLLVAIKKFNLVIIVNEKIAGVYVEIVIAVISASVHTGHGVLFSLFHGLHKLSD